jgi:hypothetical protein
VIFISRQLASIDRLLFANLSCSPDRCKDDEKAREAVTEGATLILDAKTGALTTSARDDDADRRALRHRPPSQRFASNGANLVSPRRTTIMATIVPMRPRAPAAQTGGVR